MRAALGVCDKACEAFSPSVSSQSSSSTSLCCTTPAVSPGQPPPIGQVRDATPLHAEGVFFFVFFCTQVVCEKFCDEPDCDRLCLCLLASVGRGEKESKGERLKRIQEGRSVLMCVYSVNI